MEQKKFVFKKKSVNQATQIEPQKAPQTQKSSKSIEKVPQKNSNGLNRKNLIEILNKVKPGLAQKDIVESMTQFYFTGSEVITYNDRISISYPLVTSFSAFVKATILYNILSKLSDELVFMKLEKDKLNLKSEKSNIHIPILMDSEIVERIKNINNSKKEITKWKSVPENFIECLKLCSFVVSKSDAELVISCVSIQNGKCVATDKKRLAYSNLKEKMDNMFIKGTEIKNLVQISPESYAETSGWIHFKNKEGCVFSFRKVQGEFPSWGHLFEMTGTEIQMPLGILEGIDLAAVLADSDESAIRIKFVNNLCSVHVSTEAGKIDYESPVTYSEEELSFLINPTFLKEMMRFSTTIICSDEKALIKTENFAMITSLYKEGPKEDEAEYPEESSFNGAEELEFDDDIPF